MTDKERKIIESIISNTDDESLREKKIRDYKKSIWKDKNGGN